MRSLPRLSERRSLCGLPKEDAVACFIAPRVSVDFRTSWSTIGFSSAALPRKSATDSLSAVAPWSHSGFPRAANLFVSGSSHVRCKSIHVRAGGHHASIVVFRCYPCRGVLSHRSGMSQSVNVRPLHDEHYKGIQQGREQSAAWRRWDSRHWLVSLSSVDRHRSACG